MICCWGKFRLSKIISGGGGGWRGREEGRLTPPPSLILQKCVYQLNLVPLNQEQCCRNAIIFLKLIIVVELAKYVQHDLKSIFCSE